MDFLPTRPIEESPVLPPGWTRTRLSEICERVDAVNPKTEPTRQFTYLDIASIDNSIQRISEPKVYFGKEAPSRARQLVKANDVLLSTVRPYLKNIALVDKRYDGQIASTGFCVIRASRIANPKLLFHFIQTKGFLNLLNRMQRGTSYPAVRDSDVMSQGFPLPPLPEQHRIVAKIEALFSELDKGVEQLKTAQQQLKVYRQSVLKWAFEGKLTAEWRNQESEVRGQLARRSGGEGRGSESAEELLNRIRQEREEQAKANGKKLKPITPLTEKELSELPKLPEGWVWARFGEFNEVKANLVDPSQFMDALHVAPDNISKGTGFLFQCRTIRDDKITSWNHRFSKGQILYSKIRPNLAKVTIAPFDGLCSADMYPIDSFTCNKYVMWFMLSKHFIDRSSNSESRTILPKINQKELNRIPTPVCDLAEQKRIIREIEARLSVCDKLEETISESLQQAEALRQSILKKAFEGKLVPQDPNDEPASVLLERIKKEREQNITGKTKRGKNGKPMAVRRKAVHPPKGV